MVILLVFTHIFVLKDNFHIKYMKSFNTLKYFSEQRVYTIVNKLREREKMYIIRIRISFLTYSIESKIFSIDAFSKPPNYQGFSFSTGRNLESSRKNMC